MDARCMSIAMLADWIRRGIDVGAAGLGLVLAAPVLCGTALLVRTIDGPPVLFRGQRVGRGGRPFDLLKFRTMRPTRSGPGVTAANDDRITPLGAWLRRTRIDELPQLWNVLVGDLSLVGPRPEDARYVAHYRREFEPILRVRPGVTDRTTLEFLREEELLAAQPDPEAYYVQVLLPRKIAMWRSDVEQRSLAGDVAVLLRTAGRLAQRFAGRPGSQPNPRPRSRA